MARISLQLDEGRAELLLDALFVRGVELDAGQVEAIEGADELVAFVGLLQRVAPSELRMGHVLEPGRPPEPTVVEQYNAELVESVRRYAAEFQGLADFLASLGDDGVYDFTTKARQVAEVAAEARSLVDNAPSDEVTPA